jgi:heterotetrameric sarcosine oxidase gamma subunit
VAETALDALKPIAQSPIAAVGPMSVVAGWVVSGRHTQADLTLTDMTPLSKVAVRADPAGRMAEALTASIMGHEGSMLVTSVVPGDWLVIAEAGEQAGVVAWLESAGAAEFATVVDLTHGRAMLRLTGRQASEVLAKECAVDLSDRGCTDGRALRTGVAGLAVDVIRNDRAGVPSYLMHCERSSGQYLFDALLDAGTELGIDIDGFRPPGLSITKGAS